MGFMNASDLVLVTSNYKVVALRKSDGEIAWETELVTKFFKPAKPFITLVADESAVYAHTNDLIFRLDLLTGRILWSKKMEAGGWLGRDGVASIVTISSGSTQSVGQAAKRQWERNKAGVGD